jgi:hypothetical protein
MKRVYKNLIFLSLSGLICLFLAAPANAQHGGGHGGGGGGHFSGGGGGHFGGGGGGHFSGGGGAHYSGGAARVSGGGRAAYSGGARSYAGTRGGYAGGRAYAGRVNTYGGRGYAGYRGGYGYGGRGYAGFGYHGYFGRGGFYNHGGFYNSLYFPRLGFSVGFLPFGYYPFYWGGLPYYYSNGYYYEYNDDQYTVVEPPVGAQLNNLPAKAQSIVINGQQYYELDGVYYVAITKDDGSLAYQIAGKDGELNTDGGDQNNMAPPAGNNQDYNAPDQSAAPQDQQMAPPARNGSADLQIGDVVQSLPADSRGVTVNGQRLFVSPDDVYYKKTRDNNNNVAYKIVGLPSTDPNDQ